MPNSTPQNDQVENKPIQISTKFYWKGMSNATKRGNQLVDTRKPLKHPEPHVHERNSRHLHLTYHDKHAYAKPIIPLSLGNT